MRQTSYFRNSRQGNLSGICLTGVLVEIMIDKNKEYQEKEEKSRAIVLI